MKSPGNMALGEYRALLPTAPTATAPVSATPKPGACTATTALCTAVRTAFNFLRGTAAILLRLRLGNRPLVIATPLMPAAALVPAASAAVAALGLGLHFGLVALAPDVGKAFLAHLLDLARAEVLLEVRAIHATEEGAASLAAPAASAAAAPAPIPPSAAPPGLGDAS